MDEQQLNQLTHVARDGALTKEQGLALIREIREHQHHDNQMMELLLCMVRYAGHPVPNTENTYRVSIPVNHDVRDHDQLETGRDLDNKTFTYIRRKGA